MAELDDLAPNYRRAVEHWPDAPTLTECYKALKLCFESNRHGLAEHIKAYIECVCITTIAEFDAEKPHKSKPSTSDWLRQALIPLGLENTRGASKLDTVLQSFISLAEALSDMRNQNGPVAHGKDAFLDPVTADHARAFLHTGDAILGVLFNALECREPKLEVTREPYERFHRYNSLIDSSVSMSAYVDIDHEPTMIVISITTDSFDEVVEIRAKPSELLYGVDRAAYVETLNAAQTASIESLKADIVEGHVIANEEVDVFIAPIPTIQQESESKVADATPSPTPFSGLFTPDVLANYPIYEGELDELRPSFVAILQSNLASAANSLGINMKLADVLLTAADNNLVLDWKERETLRARLKVALKRELVKSGIHGVKAEDIAQQLVGVLRYQTS